MEDEKELQKKILALCKYLPSHLQIWKAILQDIQDPIRALSNFAEQLRYVEQADIKYLENFDSVQQELQVKILGQIEEELESIQSHIIKLEKSNVDLKNKLSVLERLTIDLDWDLKWAAIKGSPTQPPLDKLLQLSYEYWVYFSSQFKHMSSTLRTINIRDEKSMEEYKKVFLLNLEPLDDNKMIYELLAVTQYVINPNSVT